MTYSATRMAPARTVRCVAYIISALTLSVLCTACSSRTTNLASSPKKNDSGGPVMDAAIVRDAQAEASTDGPPPIVITDGGITLCGDVPCSCSNGKDDDNDGLTDGFDPECTGAFDDDEDSFATGVHGEDRDARCQDCFFDGNSGPGDDGCRRAASCAIDGNASSASGACGTCVATNLCISTCAARTPNGCDCFGCCEVQTPQGKVNVLLRDTCSLASIEDDTACPRCTPATDCRNDCGRCELCPGKTLMDLPEDCTGSDGLGYTCDNAAVCGTNVPCGEFAYCVQGCCTPLVI